MGFRLAGISTDPGAVDFCYEPVGASSFTGPVFQGFGITGGLNYQQVSEYIQVATGQATIRLVGAGSTDCSTPVTGVADLTITGTPGSFTTIGDFLDSTGATSLVLIEFTDESTAKASNLRGINGSPEQNNTGFGTLDIVQVSSLGVEQDFLPAIPYGSVSPPSTKVDTNGYIEHQPFSGAELRVRDTVAVSDLLSVTPFDTVSGHVYSLFIVGVSGDPTNPMQMVVCDDTTPATSHLSSCQAEGQ